MKKRVLLIMIMLPLVANTYGYWEYVLYNTYGYWEYVLYNGIRYGVFSEALEDGRYPALVPQQDPSTADTLTRADITDFRIGDKEYFVRYIGERAFQNCVNLTTVNLPNTLITIGERAFSECSSLTSITIPNSVTSIGSRVFYCENLATVVSLIENPFEIHSYVFSQNTRMNATL